MNDPEIRELLIKKYLTKYQNTDNCLILEEVGIMHGSSIVDLTVISKFYNQAFEIKSAQDSLTRLPKQLKDYLQVFDYITIISQPSHLDEILGIAPHFVGIILVYDNGDLEYLRKPTANPFLRKEKLIQLLWRDEVYAFLREKGHKKISHLSNAKVKKMACSLYDIKEIRELVFNVLKKRVDWKKNMTD